MSILSEDWLQGVLESIRVPACHPAVAKEFLPVIEHHIRRIIQDASKFKNHSKKTILEGINTS
jgi:hypothetical protein